MTSPCRSADASVRVRHLGGYFGVTDIKAQSADGASVESGRSASRRRRRRVSAVTVLALAVAAGVAAATAGCRPTGTPVVDPLYTALLAALVTFACSRASRATLVVFALVAVVMSRTWLEIPAVVALLIALGSLLRKHSRRRIGALIGVLGVETMVRWPSVGFHGSTAAVAMAAVVPLLVSAYRRFSSAERRRARRALVLAGGLVVVLSAPFLVAVSWIRTDMSVGQRAAQTAFADISNGRSTSAAPPLRAADADFGARPRGSGAGGRRLPGWFPSSPSKSRRWPPAWLRPGTSWPSRHARRRASTIRGSTTTRARSTSGASVPCSARRTTIDGSLSTARDRLARLQSPWLIGPIQSRLRTFDTDVRRAQSSTDLGPESDSARSRHARRRTPPALLPGLRVAGRKSGARRDRRCLRRADGRRWSHQPHRLRPGRVARQRPSGRRRPVDGAARLHRSLRELRPRSALPGPDLFAGFPHRGPGHLAALSPGRWRPTRRGSHARPLRPRSIAFDHGADQGPRVSAAPDESRTPPTSC